MQLNHNIGLMPSSAKAQAQLEAELALFSLDPAPTHPYPTRESLFGSLYVPSCTATG